jgi:hypothetical protein
VLPLSNDICNRYVRQMSMAVQRSYCRALIYEGVGAELSWARQSEYPCSTHFGDAACTAVRTSRIECWLKWENNASGQTTPVVPD